MSTSAGLTKAANLHPMKSRIFTSKQKSNTLLWGDRYFVFSYLCITIKSITTNYLQRYPLSSLYCQSELNAVTNIYLQAKYHNTLREAETATTENTIKWTHRGWKCWFWFIWFDWLYSVLILIFLVCVACINILVREQRIMLGKFATGGRQNILQQRIKEIA